MERRSRAAIRASRHQGTSNRMASDGIREGILNEEENGIGQSFTIVAVKNLDGTCGSRLDKPLSGLGFSFAYRVHEPGFESQITNHPVSKVPIGNIPGVGCICLYVYIRLMAHGSAEGPHTSPNRSALILARPLEGSPPSLAQLWSFPEIPRRSLYMNFSSPGGSVLIRTYCSVWRRREYILFPF